MCGEGAPELGVAGDGGVADAVDRLDAVDDADGVQSAPRAVGEHARVDLQVEVAVRVAGPGGVVSDDGCLDPLDRHLHLSTAWPDASRRVVGDPVDDLAGGAFLGSVVRVGDRGVDRGGE